jgi:hypothetical protein
MRAAVLALACWLWAGALWAQEDPLQGFSSVSAEHERLDQRRSDLLRALAAEDAACEHAFAQSDCQARVEAHRRAEMSDLRRQESILHDDERQQRSQDQLRSVEIKLQEHEQLNSEAESAQRTAAQLEKQQAHLPPVSAPVVPAVPRPKGLDAQEQAQNREAYLRKQEAAKQRKEDLARRLQEQGSKTVQPLPPEL